MKGRATLLAAVILTAGAGTAAAQRLPFEGPMGLPGSALAVSLPATGVAAVPDCPGPETLVVPPGGQPVQPPGPVVVGAAVASGSGQTGLAPAGSVPVAELGGIPVPALVGGLGLLTLPRRTPGPVPLQPLHTPGPVLPGSAAGQPATGQPAVGSPGPGAAAARPMAGPPVTSSVQLSFGRAGDLRGLAGLACPTASTQAWLVGGGTQPGRRGRLLLANPAATPAVVDVAVIGSKGAVPAPGGTGVVVPAGGQTAVLIDALAPDLDAVAVHVQARSGRVVATLHDSYLRGLTPSGVDDVTVAAPAARRQLVPGLSIAPPAGGSLPEDPGAPGAVAVRVVDPGTTDAVVRIRLLGPTGEVRLADAVLTVAAGAVRDVPISGVPAGGYAAVVEADVPVLAGALVGRTVPGGETAGSSAAIAKPAPPSELAWAASVPALAGPAVLALPAIPDQTITGSVVALGATLCLVAPATGGTVTLTEVGRDGRTLSSATVDVPAESAVQRALSPGAAAVLLAPVAGSGPVAAAAVLQVSDAAGPLISVLPVRSGPAGTGQRPTVLADPRTGLGR